MTRVSRQKRNPRSGYASRGLRSTRVGHASLFDVQHPMNVREPGLQHHPKRESEPKVMCHPKSESAPCPQEYP